MFRAAFVKQAPELTSLGGKHLDAVIPDVT